MPTATPASLPARLCSPPPPPRVGSTTRATPTQPLGHGSHHMSAGAGLQPPSSQSLPTCGGVVGRPGPRDGRSRVAPPHPGGGPAHGRVPSSPCASCAPGPLDPACVRATLLRWVCPPPAPLAHPTLVLPPPGSLSLSPQRSEPFPGPCECPSATCIIPVGRGRLPPAQGLVE